MIVTAWNNGAHSRNGRDYGFRISHPDRDEFFKKEWTVIVLEFEGEPALVEVPVDAQSFWSETGKELTSPAVGRWLRHNGLAPWPKGNPPTIVLEPIAENRFRLSKAYKGAKHI